MARRDTNAVITGMAPNDGLGEPIRSGFIKVNDNFEALDYRLIVGNLPVVVSDTTTTKNITVTSSAVITATTAMTINPGVQGTMDNVRIGATTARSATFTTLTADTITSNGIVNILGNLVVSGNVVTQNSSDLVIQDSIINLHTPADLNPLVVNDGKDIGIKFHYYRGADGHAFLGWANDSGALEYYAAGNEIANVFVGTSYGTVKAGAFQSVNTTAATSTTTGAITTAGGIGAVGDIYSANMHTGAITADSVTLTGGLITTLVATNFSTANAQITGGNLHVNYLRGSNFSSPNVLVSGGYIENVNRLQATNFSTGNIYVTGGEKIENVIRVTGTYTGFTTGSFTDVFASNTLISNSSTHTESLYSNGYFWGNGTYLLTGVDSSLDAINANLGLYQNTTNANIGSIYNHVNTIDANIGSYQNTTNANIGSIYNHVNTIDSNIGSYHTWANANISYLQTTINNISSNIVSYQIWSNANVSSQSTDLSSLWANAATQATAIATKAPIDNPSFTTHVQVTGNVDVTGYVIATQDVIAFSDEKFKTNVTTITNALATVRLLRGVHYDRVDTGEQGTGVVAQESLPHTPRLVRKTDNGDLAVAYGNHAGYFIEAIKELADTVDEIAHEIKQLKKEIKRLKGE